MIERGTLQPTEKVQRVLDLRHVEPLSLAVWKTREDVTQVGPSFLLYWSGDKTRHNEKIGNKDLIPQGPSKDTPLMEALGPYFKSCQETLEYGNARLYSPKAIGWYFNEVDEAHQARKEGPKDFETLLPDKDSLHLVLKRAETAARHRKPFVGLEETEEGANYLSSSVPFIANGIHYDGHARLYLHRQATGDGRFRVNLEFEVLREKEALNLSLRTGRDADLDRLLREYSRI